MTTVGPIAVSVETDDGSGGAYFNTYDPDCFMGNHSSFGAVDYWAVFRSVAVPQGATINSATWTVYRASVRASTVAWKCRAVDADTASPPANNTAYGAFAWTTATVTGSSTDAASHSMSIASVIQEIVDRGGWVSGNNMLLQRADNGSASNAFHYLSVAPYTESELTIDYTAGGGGGTSKNILTLGVG